MKKHVFFYCFLLCQIFFAQPTKIFKIKKFEVATLSDSLKENSGLHFYKNQLYTFNDGGNSSELFQIDAKTGKILKKFTTNLPNNDWEALTSDESYFFFGDFGNNAGIRKDLKIYKLAVDSVVRALSSNNALQPSITLSFHYPEQKDFTSRNLKHNFDTEAMLYLNGKIHLFTKEWQSKSTTHYTLDPDLLVRQSALKIESFKAGFMVTDAAYYNEKLYLIGYTKKTEVFLQIFEILPHHELYFTRPIAKFYLGSSFALGQIEGIAVNKDGIYISGERFLHPLGFRSQKFYFVAHEKLNW